MSERQLFTVVINATQEQARTLLDGLFDKSEIKDVGYIFAVHRGDKIREKENETI